MFGRAVMVEGDLAVNRKVDAMLLNTNVPLVVPQDVAVELRSVVPDVACSGHMLAVVAESGVDEMLDLGVCSGVPEFVMRRAVLVVTAVDRRAMICLTWGDARAWIMEGLGIEQEVRMTIVPSHCRHWFRASYRHPNHPLRFFLL